MKTPKAIIFDFHNAILHEINFIPTKGISHLFSLVKNNKGIIYEKI
jgi:hypothetical protein